MDLVIQKAAFSTALKADTLLHDRYRILSVIGMDECSITYEAEDNGSRVAIREYIPMAIASRNAAELQYDDKDKHTFLDGSKAFSRISGALRKGIPHFESVTELFQENNTAYAVFPFPERRSLHAHSLTAEQVQTLGIELCESYAALHRKKMYYGILREEYLQFSEAGIVVLDSGPIRTSGSVSEDMHCLTAFLSSLLPEDEDDETAQLLHDILKYRYPDAPSLNAALLGKKPSGTGRKTGIICLLACLFFLAAAIYLFRQVPEKSVPLSGGLESGKITPEVINVWLPLKDNADEAAVCAMYERLAAGFERQNPGCGVNIRIYADNSFGDALAFLEESSEPPAVLMDIQPEEAVYAAELSTLTTALEDVYLTDMTRFETTIPLGCSVPALFYNTHWLELTDSSISFRELPEDTLYDESAADFISRQNPEQQTDHYFTDFLTDGKKPVLASTTRMAEAERTGISSGAVQMIPLSAAEGFPLQYEMYCAINAKAQTNSRRVGMLWLQYLLTEEAQQMLFVEHYGDLPLHRTAFESAVSAHSGLSALSSTAPETDTKTDTPETEVQP